MNNGRENRNNGNQEKGKEEKEALRKFGTKSKGDAEERPLSFLRQKSFLGLWLIRPPGDALHAMRDPLLLLRAQTPIRTEIAVDPGFRWELAVGNALCCIFHAGAGAK